MKMCLSHVKIQVVEQIFHVWKKVGGLTGRPGLRAGDLLMDSKHLEPPHYLLSTRQIILVRPVHISTYEFNRAANVG